MSEIVRWLSAFGLGDLRQVFEENKIDLSILPLLREQDLKDLGISLGDRRRLQLAIANLVQPSPQQETSTLRSAERRLLTVLFCDLIGSTTLSTRLDPEDLSNLVSAYRDACSQAIERYGGFISRFIGDGILACFGYPQAHEDDAERAILAGLGTVAAMESLKLENVDQDNLAVRIGIGTGLVVVGDIAGRGQLERNAIIGEAPNLASRLQGLAESNSVVIATETKRLAGGRFTYRSLGHTTLKGFDKPVGVWQVVAAQSAHSRFETKGGQALRMLGRNSELELLQARWVEAKSGKGQVVLIRGEPGIGKSRLVTAFREWVGSATNAQSSQSEAPFLITFQSSPSHVNATLFPVARQIERLAALERDDADLTKRQKLATFLARCGSVGRADTLALFGNLLGLAPEPGLQEFGPREKRKRTFDVLESWVSDIATRQPLVLVVEDLQWMDPSTRTLLARLVTLAREMPVMIVATVRTNLLDAEESEYGQDPASGRPCLEGPHVTACDLQALDDEASVQLLNQIAAAKPLPAVLVKAVLKKSEGIPLYIEELTRGLIDGGTIEPKTDGNELKGFPTPVAFPNSLRGALIARLDRAGPAREVAQLAAVIGREFSLGVLSKISGLREQDLRAGLNSLVAADIIRSDASARDPIYQFKHALVHDAAYSILLRRRRQELHFRLAKGLEEDRSYLPAITDDVIAHHYSRAGDPRRAISAWRRAASKAFQVSAQNEAANVLQLALASLAELPHDRERKVIELELSMELAAALATVRGYTAPEVERQYLYARQLCERLGEKSARFNVEFGLMASNLIRGDIDRASGFAKRLFEYADDHPAKPHVDAYLANGMVKFQQGRLLEARDFLEKGAQLGDPEHDQPHFFTHGQNPGLFCRSYLAHALSFIGKWREAIGIVENTLASARRRANEPSQVYSYVVALAFACRIYLLLGDRASVNQLSEELIDIARRNHYSYYEAIGTTQRGWAQAQETSEVSLRLGARQMSDGLAALERMEAGLVLPGFYVHLAEINIALGNRTDALLALNKAAGLRGWSTRCWDAEIERVRGEALGMAPYPEFDAAIANCRVALRIACEQGARTLELRAALSCARLLRRCNCGSKAHDLLRTHISDQELHTSDATNALRLLNELADVPDMQTANFD